MATRKTKTTEPTEPTVVKGSHLTVTTFPDGKTVLQWDDKALLRDVREALASVENKPKKAAPKKAKVEEPKTKRKIKEKQ